MGRRLTSAKNKIREKGRKAKFAGSVLRDVVKKEARLRSRNLKRRVTRRYPKIKAVLVDVDGTLLKTDIYKNLAKEFPRLKKLQDNIIKDLKNGKIKFEEGFQKIADAYPEFGINVRHIDKILNKAILNPEKLNYPLVSALHELQKKGIKIVIGTRTSYYVAEQLRKKFGFDGAIGSKEIIDKKGNFVGLEYLVGQKLRKSQLAASELNIKEKNIALISEEASDFLFDKSGYNIFFNPKKPIQPGLTKSARWLKLYDKQLKEGDKNFRKKLVTWILRPKTQHWTRIGKKKSRPKLRVLRREKIGKKIIIKKEI